MPAAVGGLPAGTTAGDLRGQTYEQIITSILFATVLAYISTPNSATLGGINASTMEVGYSYTSPLCTASYNRGTINNGDGTAGPYLTANPSEYTFKLPSGTIDASIPNTGYSQTHTYTAYNIVFGSNEWSVTVAYYAGSGAYYDNKGNPGTNLNLDRVASTVSANSSVITGRRYVWYGYGIQSSAPINSAGVRALTNKQFLGATNTITFDISIPAGTQEAYFYTYAGKTVKVELVESSYADITGDFTTGAITVNDAGGTPQSYESWVHFIGLSGYASDVTYRVTVT
jgi:hypothetical protein